MQKGGHDRTTLRFQVKLKKRCSALSLSSRSGDSDCQKLWSLPAWQSHLTQFPLRAQVICCGLCPPSHTRLILLSQISNLQTEQHSSLLCALSIPLLSIHFNNRAGFPEETETYCDWDLMGVLFKHTLDSKWLRSLSVEVRVCLCPCVFFSSFGLPSCAVFVPGQRAGGPVAAAPDSSAWTRGWSRELALFRLGRSLLSAQAATLEGLRVVCPQGIQIFGWSDELEAQGCVAGELLLYSLTLPLIICLPPKEKKKWEETAKGANTREGMKTRVGEN